MVFQTKMESVTVGLKELRMSYGLSQLVLANLCGVRQSTVSKWEHGIWAPNRLTALRLAEVLKVDFIEIEKMFM